MRYYTTLAQRVSLALPPRGSAPKPWPQREAHETLTLARNALLEGIHYYVVQPLGLPDDPVTAATLDARLAAGHALEIGRRTYSHDILLWDDHHIGLHLGVHHDDGELI